MYFLCKNIVYNTLGAGRKMLNICPRSSVFLLPGTTDMRKAINGLAQMVADHISYNVFDGSYFIFCNKPCTIIKILYWDNNGFCLWQKRLEKDHFHWPKTALEVMELRPQELSWLLDGLNPFAIKGHQKLLYNMLK